MCQMPHVTSHFICTENRFALCFRACVLQKLNLLLISTVFVFLTFNNILLMYFSYILSKIKVP